MRPVTEYPDRDAWLASRKLGASDVAAVLGVSRFKSPWDVWSSIHGLVPPQPDTPDLARGRLFERSLVQLFSDETGMRTAPLRNALVVGPEPFVTASPDMIVWAGEAYTGETKTDRRAELYGESQNIDRWDAAAARLVPADYALQTYTQMWAAESEYGFLAVLLPFYQFRWFRFRRDPAVEGALVPALRKWWTRHVVKGEPPAVDSSDTARRYLGEKFATPAEPREADPDEVELALAFARAKVAEKNAKERAALIQNQLLERLEGAAQLRVPTVAEKARLTVVRSVSRNTDWHRMARENPAVEALREQYTTETAKLPYLKATAFPDLED